MLAPSMASIANFLRGNDREFFDLFERAGENIGTAPSCSTRCSRSTRSAADWRRRSFPASGGDQITHEIIRRLNQTFVTPIEREDILQLASSLDDIVDFTEEVADYLGLYRIEAPMEQAQTLAHLLRQATTQIAAAIPLVRGFKDISAHTVEVHRLENRRTGSSGRRSPPCSRWASIRWW